MITSTANSQVKQTAALVKKAKYRNDLGLFVVEGPRMFGELPKDRVACVYVTECFLREPEHRAMMEGVKRVEEVSEDVLKAMSDTQTPQGVLALARQYEYRLEDILGMSPQRKKNPAYIPGRAGAGAAAGNAGDSAAGQKAKARSVLLLILEAVQDPGNLGTILRAGEGAGVTGVIMDSKTADIYNPKVIRSTMGSVFRVPFVRTESLSEAIAEVKGRGVRLYAAHLKGKKNYDRADYTGDTGFLIGNEAAGLSDETSSLADDYIRIPMLGKVESLNAAVAASILMFEAARQRRK